MKKEKPPLKHNQFDHYREILVDEVRAIRIMLRHDWQWVLLSIAGFFAILFFLKPLPPDTVVLASGQANSSIEVWAKRYQEYFKDAGVDLKLVPTSGAKENISLLEQKKVDVALSQGGMTTKSEDISSLGSIGYMPLWLFYRGKALEEDPHRFFQNPKSRLTFREAGPIPLLKPCCKNMSCRLVITPAS